MRIAASDFDGTLAHIRTGLIGDVVGAVKRWRRRGNIFGIVTGRDLPMLLAETDKRGMEYDFLVCINGSAVYDADRNLLAEHPLPDALPEQLMRHPAGMASMHYQLSGTGELRLLLREGSWFPNIGVPYREVTPEEAFAARDLGQISFAYTTAEECGEWHKMLLRDFPGRIAAHHNKTTIDINPVGVDKATGIEKILQHHGWEGSEVLTIGDGGNDIGMITRYTGFTVPGADEAVVKAAQRVFPDVPAMLAAFG